MSAAFFLDASALGRNTADCGQFSKHEIFA